MSESNKPLGDTSVVQMESLNCIDILIDDSGDATDGFCGSNVPLDPPPPRRPQLVSRDTPPGRA